MAERKQSGSIEVVERRVNLTFLPGQEYMSLDALAEAGEGASAVVSATGDLDELFGPGFEQTIEGAETD